jgi:hypothetical protein
VTKVLPIGSNEGEISAFVSQEGKCIEAEED